MKSFILKRKEKINKTHSGDAVEYPPAVCRASVRRSAAMRHDVCADHHHMLDDVGLSQFVCGDTPNSRSAEFWERSNGAITSEESSPIIVRRPDAVNAKW